MRRIRLKRLGCLGFLRLRLLERPRPAPLLKNLPDDVQDGEEQQGGEYGVFGSHAGGSDLIEYGKRPQGYSLLQNLSIKTRPYRLRLRTHPKIAKSAKMLAQAKSTKESQLHDFSHQRVRMLRLLTSQPRVRSTTHRLAGNWVSPGIGQGSGGSPLRLRCLI